MTSQEYNRLKELLESRISALEKSITVAYAAMERRLEGMNEFRESLKDQTARFVTKDEFNRLQDEVKTLTAFKNTVQGRNSIAIFIALAGLIVAIIAIFIK
jgi:hypothetical protein